MPQRLTEGQRTRLSAAETKLRDAVNSRRQMKALNSPTGWRRAGFDGLPSPLEDFAAIRSLELDVRAYIIERINVMAEAGWLIRPIEKYTEYIRAEASDALDHALNIVDPSDDEKLNRSMLGTAAEGGASYWTERARAEFGPRVPLPPGIAAVVQVRPLARAGEEAVPPMQQYPAWRYSWNQRSTTVKNIEEDKALGGGWTDRPDAFEPYEHSRPRRQNTPTLFGG